MEITINRRSKLGWEYTTNVHNNDRGHLVVDSVEKPYFVGTFSKVKNSIDNARDFQSIKSGGTYYNSAWFVKIDGKWRKVRDYYHQHVYDLVEFPEVTVEVE